MLRYRVAVVVLSAATLALALALFARRDVEADRAPPATAPEAVTIVDLAEEAARLGRVSAEQVDSETWLLRSEFGGVALRALSQRQQVPLHLHRFTEEAAVVLAGEVELRGFARGERTALHPAPTTVVAWPPYQAHALVNRSDARVAVVLDFVSAPDDGPTFLDGDDERVRLGDGAEVVELRADAPAGARPLRMSGLATLAVAGEAAVDPSPGPTAILVAAGDGWLDAGGAHPIRAGSFARVPAGAAIRLRARTPLALLVYQPARSDVTDVLRRGARLYSQDDEELVIRDFFRDRPGGFFVDVGAADPRAGSTTAYLEEKLGWSGVAVDARAELAAAWAARRPRTRFFAALVTERTAGPRRFYRADALPELSATSRRVAEDQLRELAGADALTVTELTVPTTSLNDLLDGASVRAIDFLSMDIEEHEPAALAGFDIERFRPQLVCIEAHRAVRDAIYAWFRAHGYARIDKYLRYDQANWYFTPSDQRAR